MQSGGYFDTVHLDLTGLGNTPFHLSGTSCKIGTACIVSFVSPLADNVVTTDKFWVLYFDQDFDQSNRMEKASVGSESSKQQVARANEMFIVLTRPGHVLALAARTNDHHCQGCETTWRNFVPFLPEQRTHLGLITPLVI